MSNNVKFAEEELRRAGYDVNDSEEGPNKWIADNVLELLEVFSTQGHSGSSAPYAIALFEKLASWKPLTPLTGADDEWNWVGDGMWQNKRNSRVFKGTDNQAYCIESIVFWEWFSSPDIDDGEPYKSYYTSRDSHAYITFPWTQPDSPEYKFVPTDDFPDEVLAK